MRRLRRRRRRVAAQSTARLRAMGLRLSGDRLHRISRFLVENQDEFDEYPEVLENIKNIEEAILDNIYALKNELTL